MKKLKPIHYGVIGGIVLFIFVILCSNSTLLILLIDGRSAFSPQVVLTSISPDGKREVLVKKQIVFPANEFIDPSITVFLSLIERESADILAEHQFKLFEDSELGNVFVKWTNENTTAIITGGQHPKQWEPVTLEPTAKQHE